MPIDPLGTVDNFASLSTKDLLEARDLYHWHLINKRNVVATAIGLYRVRKSDPWPNETTADTVASKTTEVKPPRTFENSEIRPYSWPCVLVLVDQWLQLSDFGTGAEQTSPDEVIPRTMYMPDGRTVPVCVVQVDRAAPGIEILPPQTWPDSLIGGGFPLITEAQGETNIASIGALVTDGHTVYALTSRHVTGPKGHPVSTVVAGKRRRIGTSSELQLTRKPFTEVYPDFVGRRTFLTLDAGLVEITMLKDWTSRTYGLPEVGEVADLSERNIGMPLINADVVAYGATSGYLRGKIAALFFRHRSAGGFDEVTDFLIAPAEGQGDTHPGDSGTIWHLVQKDDKPLRPIALQWGGQGFLSSADGLGYNFALAASLTNVLGLLNVELVSEFNRNAQPFWGRTGHYSIAAFATGQVHEPRLARLLSANQERISFATSTLSKKAIKEGSSGAQQGEFIPLADVPDLVWKNTPLRTVMAADGTATTTGVPGGRYTRPFTGSEQPTHFADIDEPRPDGVTLMELCLQDLRKNVTVGVWQSFYDSLGHTASKERGLLPFRVWQFFDAMVDALNGGDVDRYVAAAGLLAHYVGDAAQPLHASRLHDGLPDGTGKGVHTIFETKILDRFTPDIVTGMLTTLEALDPLPPVTNGQDAAIATVELMNRAAHTLPPKLLIDTLVDIQSVQPPPPPKAVEQELWARVGTQVIELLSDSSRTLAMLWESAWEVGGGDQIAEGELVPISEEALGTLYRDPQFVRSADLDEIGPLLH